MFGLTQIIEYPTRIACNSTSLTDNILASLPERISQEDVMNVGLSDHQLIYSTRKISRIKLEVCTIGWLKNYVVGAYKNTLFPNYKYFEGVNRAHSNFWRLWKFLAHHVI